MQLTRGVNSQAFGCFHPLEALGSAAAQVTLPWTRELPQGNEFIWRSEARIWSAQAPPPALPRRESSAWVRINTLVPHSFTRSVGFQYESNLGMKDVNHQVDHRRHDHFVRVTSSTSFSTPVRKVDKFTCKMRKNSIEMVRLIPDESICWVEPLSLVQWQPLFLTNCSFT